MPAKRKDHVKKVFKLSYDMKETEEHEINAEFLANAILSTSRALRASNKIVNGEASDLNVQVRAHEEGSFVIEFVAYLDQAGMDVLDLIGVTVGSTAIGGTVFGVIEQIKNQKITARVPKGANTTSLVLEDGTNIDCSEEIADLVSNPDVRKEIDNVLNSPLAGKTDAKAIFKDENDNEIKVVESDDAPLYKKIPLKTLAEENEERKQVTIHFSQVNFDGLRGWRVKLPNGDVESVRMKDQAFVNRINQGYEKFSKNAPYLVKLLRVDTNKANGKQSTSYTIEEVIRQL